MDANDVWDDKILIKTYENTARLSREELAKRLAKSTNDELLDEGESNLLSESLEDECSLLLKKNTGGQSCSKSIKSQCEFSSIDAAPIYNVGDYVRATYDDGVDYEAKIISIKESEGICLLKYVGYGNMQKVQLCDLVPSWGKSARQIQCLKSKQETPAGEELFTKGFCTENMKNNFNSNLTYGGIPPPPPMPPLLEPNIENSEQLSAMLMSWYMSGFYTGVYQGMNMSKNEKKLKNNCNK